MLCRYLLIKFNNYVLFLLFSCEAGVNEWTGSKTYKLKSKVKKENYEKKKGKHAIVFYALRAWIEWMLSAEADTFLLAIVATQHARNYLITEHNVANNQR